MVNRVRMDSVSIAGSNGQVLMADSTVEAGITWASVTGTGATGLGLLLTASNIGTGEGHVFKDKIPGILRLRTIDTTTTQLVIANTASHVAMSLQATNVGGTVNSANELVLTNSSGILDGSLLSLTTQGDLLGRDSSGLVRVPIGTNESLLTVDTSSDRLAWTASSAIMNMITPQTALGDLIGFTNTGAVRIGLQGFGDNSILMTASGAIEGEVWRRAHEGFERLANRIGYNSTVSDGDVHKGDLMSFLGTATLVTGSSTGRATKIPVGADDGILMATSSQNVGLKWETKAAGFTRLSPMTTEGDVISFSATGGVRVPKGTEGQVLRSGASGAAAFGNSINSLAKVGTGSDIIKGTTAGATEYRALKAGTNITVTQNTDDITFAASGAAALTATNVGGTVNSGNELVLTKASGYISSTFGGTGLSFATLNSSSKVVENPASAQTTAAASKIPISDGSGKLDTWITPTVAGSGTAGRIPVWSSSSALTSYTGFTYDGAQQVWYGTRANSDINQIRLYEKTLDASLFNLAGSLVTLADNTVYQFNAKIQARQSGGTDRKIWEFVCCAYRQGAGAATLQGAVTNIYTPIATAGAAGWTATFYFGAFGANNVTVVVTGAAATTIYWTGCMTWQGVSTDS